MTCTSKTDVEELFKRKGNLARKLENKIRVSYPIAVFLFVILVYVVGICISAFLGMVNAFFNSWLFVAGGFCLFVAGTIALWTESTYFKEFIKARVLFEVSDEEYYNWLQELLQRLYKPTWYILFGLPILLLGLHSIITFCLNRPPEFWPGISIELMSSDLFVGYLVAWSIISSIIVGFVTYLAFGACYKIAKGLTKLPIIFDVFHPDGMFGLKPLLSYFVKILALYFFDASVASVVFLTKPNLGAYLFVAGVTLPGLIGSIIALYYVHMSLSISKTRILSEIHEECRHCIDKPISIIKNTRMQTMLLLFREIKSRGDWPINISISAKTIGLLMSPTVSFLFKILLGLSD